MRRTPSNKRINCLKLILIQLYDDEAVELRHLRGRSAACYKEAPIRRSPALNLRPLFSSIRRSSPFLILRGLRRNTSHTDNGSYSRVPLAPAEENTVRALREWLHDEVEDGSEIKYFSLGTALFAYRNFTEILTGMEESMRKEGTRGAGGANKIACPNAGSSH